MELSFPERAALIRRAAARLCGRLGWAPLHEVPLPNGRRADILALRPDGGFVCIEVKSGPRDFLADAKWPDYRDYADALFFAVDVDFPQDLLPAETGLIVAAGLEADLLREAPSHPLPRGAAAGAAAALRRAGGRAAGGAGGPGRVRGVARRAAGGVSAGPRPARADFGAATPAAMRRPRRSGASCACRNPSGGREAVGALETPRHVALIGESGLDRRHREWRAAGQQAAHMIQLPQRAEAAGAGAEQGAELPRQRPAVEAGEAFKLRHGMPLGRAGGDQVAHARHRAEGKRGRFRSDAGSNGEQQVRRRDRDFDARKVIDFRVDVPGSDANPSGRRAASHDRQFGRTAASCRQAPAAPAEDRCR